MAGYFRSLKRKIWLHISRGFSSGRVYILPSSEGLVAFMLLAVLLMIAVNYNNNLAYMLTFLLGSMLVVSSVHTCANLSGIKISSISAQPVFEGEYAEFKVVLSAPEPDRYRIALAPGAGLTGKVRSAELDLFRDRVNPVSLWIPATNRGVLQPKLFVLSTGYPFSLFKAWTYLKPEAECLVYPKPVFVPLPATAFSAAGPQTKETETRPGAEDFHGLKSYQPGDPVRHIYWKGVSRQRGVFIKSFSAEYGKLPVFELDAAPGVTFESRLSALCGWVLQASNKRLSFALNLTGEQIGPGTGERFVKRCLKALALCHPEQI